MIINGKVATDQQMSIILDGEIDEELDSLAAEVERLIDEKFKQVESFRNRAARS